MTTTVASTDIECCRTYLTFNAEEVLDFPHRLSVVVDDHVMHIPSMSHRTMYSGCDEYVRKTAGHNARSRSRTSPAVL